MFWVKWTHVYSEDVSSVNAWMIWIQPCRNYLEIATFCIKHVFVRFICYLLRCSFPNPCLRVDSSSGLWFERLSSNQRPGDVHTVISEVAHRCFTSRHATGTHSSESRDKCVASSLSSLSRNYFPQLLAMIRQPPLSRPSLLLSGRDDTLTKKLIQQQLSLVAVTLIPPRTSLIFWLGYWDCIKRS